ncbi:hypothetical protein PV773_02765 [Mesorhizobium sp. CC13]|uniref:hypothetical protein n=1 Tax=Mesorhizobium sp. CC13 TaxID=3029194 RepID=UPI003266A0AF
MPHRAAPNIPKRQLTGGGRADRMLTIELNPRNRAVQVRGFGNRTARQDELQVLGRWAKARGVSLVEH